MDLGLKGKKALVCASSRGLGLAVAKALYKEGAEVLLHSSNEENLKKAQKSFPSPPRYYVADLRKEEEIKKMLEDIQKKGGVDILVINTGGPKPGSPKDLSLEDWKEGEKLILSSAIQLIEGVLPSMKEKNWGRITLITSITVKKPQLNLTLSNVYRLALIGYIKTLIQELQGFSIHINVVCPGFFLTDRLKELLKKSGKKEEDLAKEVPLRRIGSPDELGDLIAFLSSERVGYLHGAIIPVDGGYYLGY